MKELIARFPGDWTGRDFWRNWFSLRRQALWIAEKILRPCDCIPKIRTEPRFVPAWDTDTNDVVVSENSPSYWLTRKNLEETEHSYDKAWTREMPSTDDCGNKIVIKSIHHGRTTLVLRQIGVDHEETCHRGHWGGVNPSVTPIQIQIKGHAFKVIRRLDGSLEVEPCVGYDIPRGV